MQLFRGSLGRPCQLGARGRQADLLLLPRSTLPAVPPHPRHPGSSPARLGSSSPLVAHSSSATLEAPSRTEKQQGVVEALPQLDSFRELLPGFRVVIAGAGIAGLTLALALLKRGIRCTVLERDVTAVRGEGKIRGPIQVPALYSPACLALSFLGRQHCPAAGAHAWSGSSNASGMLLTHADPKQCAGRPGGY
jgi:hypothetical protein